MPELRSSNYAQMVGTAELEYWCTKHAMNMLLKYNIVVAIVYNHLGNIANFLPLPISTFTQDDSPTDTCVCTTGCTSPSILAN